MRTGAVFGRALLAGITLVGGGLIMAPAAVADTVQANAVDNAFQPNPITVTAGDTIVWTNTGQRPHTVTADDGSFNSGNFTNGQTFSRTFNTPGTFAYFCSLHGAAGGIGMSGTITVRAAAPAPTAAPPTTAAPVTAPTTVAPAAAPTTRAPAAAPTTRAPAAAPTTVAPAAAPTTVAPVAAPAGEAAPAATPLARTGFGALSLVLIGAGLVVMGVGCVRGAYVSE